MLKTTLTQSDKNSPLSIDRAENAKLGNKTNSTTRLAKNLPLNIAEDAEIGGNSNSGDNKTVKRLPLSK